MSYPFRYYGRDPSDWFEGASFGHRLELVFRLPPTDAEKQAIARAFEGGLAEGPAEPSGEPWLWSGRFALLTFGERWAHGRARAAFGRMAGVALAIHREAPLEAVVLRTARGQGTSAWDAWSAAQSLLPPPGPRYGASVDIGFYRRPNDPSLPDAAPDAAFEAARRGARQATEARRLRQEADARLASGEVALVPVAAGDVPPWHDPAEGARAAFGFAPDDRVFVHATGQVAAVLRIDDSYLALDVVGEGGKRSRVPLEVRTGVSDPAFRSDGGALLVAVDNRTLCEVALPSGTTTVLWRSGPDEGSVGAVAYAAGDRPVVLTEKRLILFERRASGLERLADAGATGEFLGVLLEGHGFLVKKGRRGMALVGEAGGKLKALGSFSSEGWHLREVDGRVLVSGRTRLEMVNHEAAYRAFADPVLARQAKLAKAARAARAAEEGAGEPAGGAGKPPKGKAKARTIEVVARTREEVGPDDDPAPSPAELAALGKVGGAVASPSGRAAAWYEEGNGWGLAWVDAKGTAHRAPVRGGYLKCLVVTRDGSRALACTSDDIRAVDLDGEGPPRKAFTRDWGEVGNLAYLAPLPDGRLLVAAEKGVLLLAPKPDGAYERAAFHKMTRCGAVLAIASGRAAVAIGTGKERVVGFAVGDKLTPVVKLTNDFAFITTRGDRAFAIDRAGQHHELVGLGGEPTGQ